MALNPFESAKIAAVDRQLAGSQLRSPAAQPPAAEKKQESKRKPGTFNIDTFRGEIAAKGILPTTHFLLYMDPNFGGARNQGRSATADTLTMRCEAATIPGVSLMMQDVIKYGYGPISRMPHAVQYPMLTLTFIMDQEGAVHKFFKDWTGKVIRHDSKAGTDLRDKRKDGMYPYQVGYKKGSGGYAIPQMTLAVFDRQLTRVVNCTFYDVFPVQLNDIQLSWGEQDTPVRFSVTLTFTDMDVEHEQLVDEKDTNAQGVDPNNDQTRQQQNRKKRFLDRLGSAVNKSLGPSVVDGIAEEGVRLVKRLTE